MALRATMFASALHSTTFHSACEAPRGGLSSSSKASFSHRILHPPRLRHRVGLRASRLACKAHEGNGSSEDPTLEDYLEVKVQSVRLAEDKSAVIHLQILNGEGAVLPVHVGQSESNALMSELNNKRQHKRPLTHDIMKNMLLAIGYRISKIRITEIVSNTYYARIHLTMNNGNGSHPEVDVDARPSDAINLAVRFGAKMYVSKRVAEVAAAMPPPHYSGTSESNADILQSIRETVASYEDPTIMFQLEKDLAVRQERFEDAQNYHNKINDEMTSNPELRLIVAMEAAAADGRFEEAARLRDEFNRTFRGKLTERKW